ncbi:peptide-methionine (S)-S-oxide reductase MsrA [Puniceicoccaceae bacterium K14]|nr:peptide-methionine (S)-S-oxide reductase MsrA [Puniceicoccaceae bacterium K14]
MKNFFKFFAYAIAIASMSTTYAMKEKESSKNIEVATLGAGCFWCIEAVMLRVEGVETVVSGYTGGHLKNPSYKDVTTGRTGHAEVAQISFDTSKISFAEILEIFWQLHDPTTLNRQGNDVGTHYRSAIFYHSDEQKSLAEKSIKEAAPNFTDPIVTEITELGTFYKAEGYHQNYYNLNSNQPYCRYVIHPKLKKLGLD